jgi:hypothetical protein
VPRLYYSPNPAFPILQLTEKLLDLENETMMRVAELEKQLLQREKELESIKVSVLQRGQALTEAPGPRALLFFYESY